MPRRGLYLVTPDVCDTGVLLARVGALLPHAALLQYRNKLADGATRRIQAFALQALCSATGVPLVVNDDAGLAHACGAAGVHLGEEDGAIGAARALLGSQAIIGASCYDSFPLAARAVADGASYVAFGAVFASSTKPHARRADARLFAQAVDLGVPSVAIGGIDAGNIGEVIAMGADLAAVISGVFDAPDPVAAARACAAAFAQR